MAASGRVVALLLAGLALPASGLPKHSRFQVGKGGVIELAENPSLRVNVKGGDVKAGDPLVLWPCSAHGHEIFEFADGLIRLKANKALCLNAHGGVQAGTPIISWPCAQHGQPEEHEEFTMGADGRIRLQKHPNMCINVKGGLVDRGSELVLWPCGGSAPGAGSKEDAATDLFVFEDSMIKVKENPDFHINMAGGELGNSTNAVLWDCQPALHEMFEFTWPDRRIKVKAKPDMCVNAEGGVGMGNRLIIWPCSPEPGQNEKWLFNEQRQTIQAHGIATLTWNVKQGNMAPGGEIILWTTDEEEL